MHTLIIYNTTSHNNLVIHHTYNVNFTLKVKGIFSSEEFFYISKQF